MILEEKCIFPTKNYFPYQLFFRKEKTLFTVNIKNGRFTKIRTIPYENKVKKDFASSVTI